MNCVAYGIVVYGGATVIDFGDAPYAVDLFGTSTGVLLGVHHEACHVAPAHEPQNRPWPVSEGDVTRWRRPHKSGAAGSLET